MTVEWATYRGAWVHDKDPMRTQAIRLRRAVSWRAANERPTGGTGGVRQLRWSFRFFCQILKGSSGLKIGRAHV